MSKKSILAIIVGVGIVLTLCCAIGALFIHRTTSPVSDTMVKFLTHISENEIDQAAKLAPYIDKNELASVYSDQIMFWNTVQDIDVESVNVTNESATASGVITAKNAFGEPTAQFEADLAKIDAEGGWVIINISLKMEGEN